MCIVSIYYGVILIAIKPAILTTATAALVVSLGMTAIQAGVAYFICGLLGVVGVFAKRTKYFLWLLVPQLAILLYRNTNAIQSALRGVFSNGYTPPVHPHLFIFTDQIHTISLPLIYAISLIVLIYDKK